MLCGSFPAFGLSVSARLKLYLVLVFAFISVRSPVPAFEEQWQLIEIIGQVAQIRDYLGRIHYKRAGETLEGAEIVEVNTGERFVRLRDLKTGQERKLTSIRGADGRPPRPPGAGTVHSFSLGEPEGLETQVLEIWIEGLPLRELIFRLSDAASFSFVITREVRDIPVTVRLSNITVREFLNIVLPAHGCGWESINDSHGIRVNSDGDTSESRDRVEGPRPGDRKGLDTVIPRIEVYDRPIKDVLGLIWRFSGLNFLTSEKVPNAPVTMKMTNVTVRQILNSLLPSYGLFWI